ncbi:MAG: hypothetical protein H6719_10640 [Sandaracinaceae bacterium]|nr:hypothetical protein [Sandaracinaceae bacterium]
MSASHQPSSSAIPLDEPTVLLIAEGERLAPALAARLVERGMLVEQSSIDEAASTAFVAAPDLVVLAGVASTDGGLELLAELGSRPGTSTLPVVLIADPEEDRPLRSTFRHGVVGVIDRTASADEMARRIEEIVRELPERDGQATGHLEETSLEEVVALFAESLRSGILSVAGTSGPSAQVMIRADRPVHEAIAELVERIRPLLGAGDPGPLRYEFHESPMARLSTLDVFDEPDQGRDLDLEGRRVLLIEQNPARSDVLAQALRAEGAVLVVIDGAGNGLELAHDLMPEVVLIDGGGVEGWATPALRAIRRDPWLRWASLLIVDADRLWANPRRPDIAMLAPNVAALVEPDQELAARVRARASTHARLDVIGPVRLIRALSATQLGLRLQVQHPRVRVEIDLADGLVAGASARARGRAESVDGLEALSTLLGLGSGRVHISHEEAPRTANVMTPVDDALAAAAAERPAVAPSIPPPSIAPPPPDPPKSDPATSLPNMMRKLEVLLDALSRSTPSASAGPRGDDLPPADEDAFDDEEITGLYEARLVDRLRKRVQHVGPRPATVAPPPPPPTGVMGLPPPKARIPKPGERPPPRKPPPPKGGLPPKAPRAAPETPPAQSGRRRRPIRAGQRTLVLGSVQSDGSPPPPQAPPVQMAVPEPPPDDEPELEDATLEGVVPVIEAAPPPTSEPAPPLEEWEAVAEVAPAPFEPVAPMHAAPEPEPLPPPVAPAEPPPAAMEPAPIDPFAMDEALAEPVVPGLSTRPIGLWLAGGAVGLALLAGGVGLAVWALSGSEAAPVATTEDPPAPEADVDPDEPTEIAPAPEATDPVAADPAAPDPLAAEPVEADLPEPDAPAPTPAPPAGGTPGTAGPGPGEPLEGDDADFDLSRLGIPSIPPPDSRRRRNRLRTQLIQRANRLRRDGDLDEAERVYHQLLGTFPEDTRGAAGLARLHVERGEPARGIVFAQRLVRLRPRFANNWVFLGDVLRDAGNRDAARRAYEHSLELDPRRSPARDRLAQLDE